MTSSATGDAGEGARKRASLALTCCIWHVSEQPCLPGRQLVIQV